MNLQQHAIPDSSSLIDGTSIDAGIAQLSKTYRAVLDKNYTKDIPEVHAQIEADSKRVQAPRKPSVL